MLETSNKQPHFLNAQVSLLIDVLCFFAPFNKLSCSFMSKAFFRFKENHGNRHFTVMPTYWALIVFIKNNKRVDKVHFCLALVRLVLPTQTVCFLYLL